MTSTYDAVVIGAGPNGLVAANLLVDAGWSVLVLEAQPKVGGAVASDRGVDPDFVHDTFSAFYPLAAASPTLRDFRLEEHGLEWLHPPAVLGHATPGGWAILHRDRDVTAAGLERLHPGDGQAWLDLCATWDHIGDEVVHALLAPFPPVRSGLRAATKLRRAGGLDLVRMLLSPVADVGRELFGGPGPRLLLAGNAGHADIPLDAPGSGLMGVLMSMLAQTVGFPVPAGGAGELAAALERRLVARGGEVRCGAEVTAVDVRDGRATGVMAAGERFGARRAVVADVVAPKLYGGLVAAHHLPDRFRRRLEGFSLDPGTVKVDWALDGPVPWAVQPEHAPGTVHVADSVDQMADALHMVSNGSVPADPFLLVGQMTTADPSRSPAGTESLWAYTHVPQEVRDDAGGEGLTGRWDRGECERFADRVQARFERLAPGFGDRVRARRVLGPHEMEARDANLMGGSINGGTAQIHQQLFFRPVTGWGRAETPIRGLYLGSASAHPGGGVHGAPGSNAARAAIAHDRVQRVKRLGRA
ncbi:NAD(P)/FAD-dependent oxidoreductase [Nocardioides sp. ChNu-99]|uniref:phytoene desaturase family protein n=1 Tax=Nocardioides sp. ChNu-99 TaxID=2839897 RepID=UPI00240594A7|nr:NAD(P)/FAD-dependent oxidoreductase [Nocardioides sp. ChNu-99]MDF9717664.1 NAD(P)/FAD-dependent oxidoreductase [Nocardioides sp. ChNu-99]